MKDIQNLIKGLYQRFCMLKQHQKASNQNHNRCFKTPKMCVATEAKVHTFFELTSVLGYIVFICLFN